MEPSHISNSTGKTGEPVFSEIGTLLVSNIEHLHLPESIEADALARALNDSFNRIVETIREAQGILISTAGDSSIAIWSSETSMAHGELALECGRKLALLRKGDAPNATSYVVHILLATGPIACVRHGGQLQVTGGIWESIRQLESFTKPEKSQMLFTAETVDRGRFREKSTRIGTIKNANDSDVPVYEFQF